MSKLRFRIAISLDGYTASASAAALFAATEARYSRRAAGSSVAT